MPQPEQEPPIGGNPGALEKFSPSECAGVWSNSGSKAATGESHLAGAYFKTVTALLVLTSLVKMTSAAGQDKILGATDPVLGISYRSSMVLGAAVELLIAGLLVSRVGRRFRLPVVFWLGSAFCGYHTVLAVLDPPSLCPCLGTLFSHFGLAPRQVELLARAIAVYLFLGPICLWVLAWLEANRGQRSRRSCSL
jgi:hypothetical protein